MKIITYFDRCRISVDSFLATKYDKFFGKEFISRLKDGEITYLAICNILNYVFIHFVIEIKLYFCF